MDHEDQPFLDEALLDLQAGDGSNNIHWENIYETKWLRSSKINIKNQKVTFKQDIPEVQKRCTEMYWENLLTKYLLTSVSLARGQWLAHLLQRTNLA